MSSVKVKRIFFLSFLFSLHIAISAYVNSSFLSTFFQDWFIGILYSIASVITLYLLSESTALLKNFGNRTLAIILLFFNIASLFGLISAKNSYFAALSFIVFFITNSLTYFCVDIFIEHFGNPKNIGKTRSMYLMIVNLGWLVAPFISGYLIGKGSGGYQIIYLYSLYIVVLMMFLFLFAVPPFKDRTYTKTPFLETYQFLKTNKHIFAISAINFILQFFFVWMVIYTPIYLHEFLKFNWTQIGIIFTIMLAPFVLFGLPIGILIDKFHFHKRRILSLGIVIAGISTMVMSGFASKNIIFWAVILFVTRVGAVIIETTSEIYFFTHVREEDAHLLSVFRDMTPVAYVIAPLLGTGLLFFFNFKYLFLFLGIIMLISLYYVSHLKHSDMPNHLYKPINE